MEYTLNDKWILYLQYKDLGTNYNENLQKLIEINNIKTFWQTFNNIPKIYQIFSDGVNIKKMKMNMSTPCAYAFFKNDIKPFWEDPMNVNGFEFSVKNNFNLVLLQEQWMDSIVKIVSHDNDLLSHINGIRIVDCTKWNSVLYRMEFWVDDVKNKSKIESLLRSEFNLKAYTFLYREHSGLKE